MRQPLVCAQFASVTTSCGVAAVAVQMASIEISPDQFRYACLNTAMLAGKFGGSGQPPPPESAIAVPGNTRNTGNQTDAQTNADARMKERRDGSWDGGFEAMANCRPAALKRSGTEAWRQGVSGTPKVKSKLRNSVTCGR
jgi:hypothetical protein